MKKIFKQLCTFALAAAMMSVTAFTAVAATSYYQIIDSPSASEISAYAQTLPEWSTTTTYTVEPGANGDINEYGVVDDYILEEALADVNYIRYIAGLASVELDDTLTMYAQAGAYVNYLNNVQSHYPEQPAGLSSEVYNLGYKGTSHSNIFIWPKTPQAGIDPYMKDSGTTNITKLGHRRWILNPSMAYIGFGQAGTSNLLYSTDKSGSNVASDIAVIWPATNMPVDYFGDIYPWSFSTNNGLYGDVTVTLTKDDGTVWNFDDSTKDTSGNYFNVNNDSYGQSGCVIFRPESPNIEAGDQFQVEIYMDGSLLADYTVSFFDVDNVVVEEVEVEIDDVVVEDVEVSAHSFTDVVADSNYEDAVTWAVHNGVTSGVTDTTFEPNSTCTRGQVVTFLWRASGEPTPVTTENTFTDVSSDDYYYKAVLWAVENGITAGTTETTFSPTSTCTTAEVLTFLYRANGEPDKTDEGEYYEDAVNWATAKGLASDVVPSNQSPRADIVTYLYINAGSPE